MLLRPGAIPTGDGWTFELKYDGFRAIVATGDTAWPVGANPLEPRNRRLRCESSVI
jgi:hypothetical protein